MERSIFYNTLLNQMKDYLNGKISKEEYYNIAESYYSEHASKYDNQLFHRYFLSMVADACLKYIDEPGLTENERNSLFNSSISKAYEELQKCDYR